jgi:hypothetical protein
LFDGGLHLVGVAYVALEECGSAAVGANFIDDCLAALHLDIGNRDGGAFRRKQASDRLADAGRGSANPCHLVLKSICHCSNHF